MSDRGWICPKCESGNAPTLTQCPCSHAKAAEPEPAGRYCQLHGELDCVFTVCNRNTFEGYLPKEERARIGELASPFARLGHLSPVEIVQDPERVELMADLPAPARIGESLRAELDESGALQPRVVEPENWETLGDSIRDHLISTEERERIAAERRAGTSKFGDGTWWSEKLGRCVSCDSKTLPCKCDAWAIKRTEWAAKKAAEQLDA